LKIVHYNEQQQIHPGNPVTLMRLSALLSCRILPGHEPKAHLVAGFQQFPTMDVSP